MARDTNLLASAPTLEAIRESVMRFYCGQSMTLVPTSETSWKAIGTYDSKEALGVRVRKVRNRYRFEMV